jgi:tetratricopeptide (TPR) repeat protein
LIGFSGCADRNQYLLSLMQRLPPGLREDWWFAAWYGFVHTELGQRAEGRRIVEQALATNPRNANAIHALAHVFYEAGEPEAAAELLDAWLPGYGRAAPLHCHLSWHHALSELERGNLGAAWAIYHDALTPAASSLAPPINALTDAAAFLWRVHLRGEVVPREEWEAVRALADGFAPGIVFADLHAALVYAICEDLATLQFRLESLRRSASAGTIALPLAEGLAAFARGEFAQAVTLLTPVKEGVVCVGGSGAQRDLFLYTLLAAYQRTGCATEAAVLHRQDIAR